MLLAVLLLLLGGGCRSQSAGPEEALRQTIAAAAAAAEQRELRTLASYLAADYRDEQGRDRDAVLGVLRYHFLGHRSIHLLTRIGVIEIADDGQARGVVLVAMAGEPIVDPNEPAFLRASLYRFEFFFVQEKERWVVSSARWQPAQMGDFLPR